MMAMSIRPILTAPDPRLRQVSKPVEKVDDELRALMDDMLETMYDAPGIGLAAIQIGVPLRVIVMDLAGKDEEPEPRYFVNPEIPILPMSRLSQGPGNDALAGSSAEAALVPVLFAALTT